LPARMPAHITPYIEDYALIGDCHTVALVSKQGSIDWLCVPRFDSGACFASLLGKPCNGRWLITPAAEQVEVTRSYRGDTLVLDTRFRTAEGEVLLTDFMPIRDDGRLDVVRIVRGIKGKVPMRMELILRFDYGSVVPWVQHAEDGITAIAGPDRVHIHTDRDLKGKDTAAKPAGGGESDPLQIATVHITNARIVHRTAKVESLTRRTTNSEPPTRNLSWPTSIILNSTGRRSSPSS